MTEKPSSQETSPSGSPQDMCKNDANTKCLNTTPQARERRRSISMIDLSNNINDISCLRAPLQDDINGFCQAKSAEDIWYSKKKFTQDISDDDSLKERLLTDSTPASYMTRQEELQGT